MPRSLICLSCVLACVPLLAQEVNSSPNNPKPDLVFTGKTTFTIVAPPVVNRPPSKTGPAVGTGKIDDFPPPNGGIEVPKVETDSGSPPERRDKELKGPVRGVRVYSRSGCSRPELLSATEYDRQGRLIRQMEYANGVASMKRLITFSPRGNRTEVRYYGGNGYSVYGYNARGRMISLRDYYRNSRGAWEMSTRETIQHDELNRKARWTEGTGDNRTRGWIQYNPAGQVARVEKVSGSIRYIEEYQYDSQGRITWYKLSYNYRRDTEANWRYDDQGVQITKWRDQYDNGPCIERFRYDTRGNLLTREWSAWNYRKVSADATTAQVSTPYQQWVGDPPLYMRTVYTYDAEGRLQRVEHFDGNGAPAYQSYGFSPPRTGCCVFDWDQMAYARVEYTYEKDGAHWTAYDVDGNIALRPLYDETAAKWQPPVLAPMGIWTVSKITLPPPRIRHDRYGNWIDHDGQYSRKITYY